MEWEIGGGGEARVAVGRSYTHAEHGKVGTNGKGREGRRKKEAVGRDGGELEGSSIDEAKSGGVPKPEGDFPSPTYN